MNATCKLTIVATAAAVCGVGCAGRRGIVRQKPRLNMSLDLADYVLNPPVTRLKRGEKACYGTGQCAVYENQADADLAIKTADNLAKQDILSVVTGKIAEVYDYHARIAGNTNPEITRAYQNNLAKENAMDIPGVEIVKREYRKGVIYSQARWSQTATNIRSVIEQAKAIARNDEATRSLSEAEPIWKEMHERLRELE